ncbi:flagellar hook-basal body complex protein FliE [Desulfotomaculum copahuensis]|uniref:Flagellar hook-basal body complex protein FliE n=2 Tax=Desulfotomaculum copahuensis TaxID=1838280 RepID=A0A1B7LBP0_9FIRM|nr:flagellar hook-basal body complex protein FliE [Desulfotomaculum copahuensis]
MQATASAQSFSAANVSGANAPSFGDMLNQALEQVNGSQVRADRTAEEFFTGRLQDIHQVTVAMEEARIMMDLAVQVRNKMVEAYQEISRMQV